MSHFLLTVFTDCRPCEDQLSQILAPYEETAHNPQSKWDWWMIGGRWHGELLLKRGVNDFILGDPGLCTDEAPTGHADGVRIGNLDWKAMLEKSRQDRASHWDTAHKEQQAGAEPHPWTVNTAEISRDDYIALATSFTPFAFILDGQWHEKGEMGWFGMAQNEKFQAEWNAEFATVLKQQSEDHWITVIDCHI